jgi:hypothetical protein
MIGIDMITPSGDLREIRSRLPHALSGNGPFINNQNAKFSAPLREI